jgi:inosine-uridine nucleoside N-ribohydrolase
MSSNVTNVWLDCDPGHDDAFAILLCDNPLIKLLGISTVHGNQTVEKTTANAIKTLALGAIWNIPVVAGLSKPVVVEARECPEIHGETGLDAPNSSFPTTSQKPVECDNAITYIKDQIMKCSSKVTVVATGCLTNVAMLLTLYPRIKERIDKIVVLGGAVGVGNISAAAEFNILVDPHAAHIVFESGCESECRVSRVVCMMSSCRVSNIVFLITIDTTHTNLVTAARTQQIKAAIGDISSFAKVVFGERERCAGALSRW